MQVLRNTHQVGNRVAVSSGRSQLTSICRGTAYGLSAALGKTGAAVGTQAFTPIQIHLGKKWTFIIAALCGVTGILVTYFFVPDLTGVDLAEEDAKFMQYLADNGWEGEVGEDDSKELIVNILEEGSSEDVKNERTD